MSNDTCPKWTCQQPLERTVKRTCCNSAVTTTVITVRCPRCGYDFEDYEVQAQPGKQQPHQRDLQMERVRRYRRTLKRQAVQS